MQARAGRCSRNGGRRQTGLDAIEWIARAEKLGAGEILLTSMDRDGTRNGYDIESPAQSLTVFAFP